VAKVPTDLSDRKVRAALERAGFTFVRQKGNHMILRRSNPAALVVVPDHRHVKPGTLRGIIADAGFTVDEFVDLLK
jgi:predicted RNA binding protein YcfA (HicA-like mRNA interferase family)